MLEILFCINQIIELFQILICLNYLFRPKYCFKICDGIFIAAELMLSELVNLNHWNEAVLMIAYLGIYAYALVKFKGGLKKTTVNVVLLFVINSFVQLLCSGLLFLLCYIFQTDRQMGGFVAINVFTLLLLMIGSRKERFYRLSRFVLESNCLTYVAMIGSFFVIAYLLIVYKLGNYFRVTDYLVFGVVTVLIWILAISWQKEKCEKTAKEKEIALREQYDSLFQDLVTSARKKQHDIDDHINVIFCQHKIAKTLDELVSLQKEYCNWIIDENSFSHLLAIKNPVLGGFLYSKFCQAKEAGCRIKFDIKVDSLSCCVPIYKIVEILTVLLNNAREALEEQEKKNLFVKIQETENEITFLVQNSFPYIPRKDLVDFLKLGYSTKGESRGLGLAKVMDIIHDYNGEIEIRSGRDEDDSWISFQISFWFTEK